MKRNDYLRALNRALRRAGIADRQKTLDFYAEMIDDGREQGLSEAEAVARLDAPEEVVRVLCLESSLSPRRKHGAMEWVLLVLGSPFLLALALTFFALLIAALAVLFAALVAVDAAEFSLLAAGIGSLGMCAFGSFPHAASLVFAIGTSLVIEGLALLLFRPVLALNACLFRALASLTAKTCASIKRMISERRF
ncbi:MAG: DUF1700 domain-containing protein [Clostridia bacterium]|nr:DUF1700 domain-containing protein [Clostridia bacterium]